MSRAVVPSVPESIFSGWRESEDLPSHVTLVVNATTVYAPQTHQPWYIEMDHEMGNAAFYSLVPKATVNQYVAHYEVESRRPRLVGSVQFTDAWITTHHKLFLVKDAEIHLSQTLFSPLKADDKLYFDRPPMRRMEVVVRDRFIADRELWEILETVVPREYEIRSLVQRQS
jgi:hypothetical protein